MGITYHPTSGNKGQKKHPEFGRDDAVLEHNSPDASSRHQDLETDLREFLETGPILRVCDSPTG